MHALPGVGAGTASKGAVRSPRNITKTFNYTLTARAVPPGFPPCQESNLVFWGLLDGGAVFHPDPFSFAGATGGLAIEVAPCDAATGDSMHATLDISYGNMRFVTTGNGDFKLDSVDDSEALLTVTDNTTGYSSNTLVYISF